MNSNKKILFILNYYYPYISGVSEYARLLAERFVKEGYEVSVLTSNHENLLKEEIINGVRVIRSKVILKISKGVISLEYIFKAARLSKEYDVVHLHLPMLESGLLSLFIPKEKLIVTYQCDVNLPKTLLNNFIVRIMDISNNLCLKNARKILVTSKDYAMHSRIAYRYAEKIIEAGAPIKEYAPSPYKDKSNKKSIGFCGRIVEEKGIDVLLKAYEKLRIKRSDIQLIIGGDYEKIAGGSIYSKLKKYIENNHIEEVNFLGAIPEEKMAAFYSSLDVMTLPSINSLEAFGMVQIEAMLCGTPVVASDLPGVRTIIQKTGMGEIARQSDVDDLAEKIELVLDNKKRYIKSRKEIMNIYGMNIVYQVYRDAYFEANCL